jgi:hypothetical protein
MRDSYLVQRLKAPAVRSNPFSFGGGLKDGGLSGNAMDLIRPIFSFDYMGSAEFEFGAIPETLNFLRETAVTENLEVFTIAINVGRGVVYVIAPSKWRNEVTERVRAFASAKPPRTKEHVGLRAALTDPAEPRHLGWLEISNGYFFFIDRDMFVQTAALFGLEA